MECGYEVWLAFFSLDDSPWEENAFNKVTVFQAGSSRTHREGHKHWAIAGPRRLSITGADENPICGLELGGGSLAPGVQPRPATVKLPHEDENYFLN